MDANAIRRLERVERGLADLDPAIGDLAVRMRNAQQGLRQAWNDVDTGLVRPATLQFGSQLKEDGVTYRLLAGLNVEIYDGDPATTGVLQTTQTTDASGIITYPYLSGAGWYWQVTGGYTGRFSSTFGVPGADSYPKQTINALTYLNFGPNEPNYGQLDFDPVPASALLVATSSVLGASIRLAYDATHGYWSGSTGTVQVQVFATRYADALKRNMMRTTIISTGVTSDVAITVNSLYPSLNFEATFTGPRGGTWTVTE